MPVIAMVQQHTVIFRAGHIEPDTTILEVGERSKPICSTDLTTDKGIRFMLETIVQIPFMAVIIIFIPKHIVPDHGTDMVSVIS